VTAGTLFYEAKVNGWRDDGSHPKPTPEELAERRRQAAERAAKEEAEKHARYEAAAAKAAKILAVATDDPTTHSYAIKKRVSFGPLVKRGAWPQRGWPDALLVPIYGGDGRLWSIEAINADGAKDSLKDGRKTGGFHPLGTICGASRVLISEGLANAAVGGQWTARRQRRQWVRRTFFIRRWPCESWRSKPRSSSSPTTI
jgi:putative DNA primase/helicase